MKLEDRESRFTRQVVAAAERAGWYVYHIHKSKNQIRNITGLGFPDLVLVKDRVLYRELKVGKNNTSPEQDRWIHKLRGARANVGIWTPKDWIQIEAELGAR